MIRRIVLLAILFAGIAVPDVSAQNIAVKSNLLDVTATTLNIGAEFGLAPRWTLHVPLSINPWRFGGGARYCHWGAQPEARYWFSRGFRRLNRGNLRSYRSFTRFSRGFVGMHLHYAGFNFGNWPDWIAASDNMKQFRYEGYLYGGGISAGYYRVLKKPWSMEISGGLGYARVHYKKYPCSECGSVLKESNKNYFGPTKVSVSLIYMIQ